VSKTVRLLTTSSSGAEQYQAHQNINIMKKLFAKILYKLFKYDLKWIGTKDYYENGKYIITEPVCLSCDMYTKNYWEHSQSKY